MDNLAKGLLGVISVAQDELVAMEEALKTLDYTQVALRAFLANRALCRGLDAIQAAKIERKIE